MDCKPIIHIVAKGALAIILLRKVRGYAVMAQQLSFVPKVYDKPKVRLSKPTVPIRIDVRRESQLTDNNQHQYEIGQTDIARLSLSHGIGQTKH